MRKYLVAGNWKMHGDTEANATLVAGVIAGQPDSDNVEMLVCPPFPYLAAIAAQVAGSRLLLGAQTVSEHDKGAFTGEVAPGMLRDIGCDLCDCGAFRAARAVSASPAPRWRRSSSLR